jgi:hypothetical protein
MHGAPARWFAQKRSPFALRNIVISKTLDTHTPLDTMTALIGVVGEPNWQFARSAITLSRRFAVLRAPR